MESDRIETDVRGRTVVWSAGAPPVRRHPVRQWWGRIGLALIAVVAVAGLAAVVRAWTILAPVGDPPTEPLWIPQTAVTRPAEPASARPTASATHHPSSPPTASRRGAAPTTDASGDDHGSDHSSADHGSADHGSADHGSGHHSSDDQGADNSGKGGGHSGKGGGHSGKGGGHGSDD